MASTYKTAICLLRNDLRFHDNEVLHLAHKHADRILPVYCFDPRHYKNTYHFNFTRTGPHRLKFLLETIHDLRKTLQKHGSNLIVRRGKPEVVIPDIIDKLGKDNVSHLIFQEEPTQEEQEVENDLRKNFTPIIKSIWGTTLYHKDDVSFQVSKTPDVYQQFRQLVEQKATVRPVIQMPDQLKPLPEEFEGEDAIPAYEDFKVPKLRDDSRSAFPFAGGESAALKRLEYYLWGTDKISKYIDTRNGLIGKDFSTKFSPWLANGSLSPRTIFWEVKRYEKEKINNKSTYWVIFELIWRDFFKFVALKYGVKLFYLSGIRGQHIEWKQDMELFNAWKEGRTGVPFVDANMRELSATGFMSNRGRQNVASFLVKDLKLDWRLGAEWFECLLLDHDVCSNYGNWQYSASVGNDPRQDRKFNMIKQGTDYDPDGEYIRLWIPELQKIKGRNAHVPWTLSKSVLDEANVEIPGTYPHPIVIAPEWNRHLRSDSAHGGRKNPQHPGSRRPHYNQGGSGARFNQQRGINYYFSSNN